MPWLRAWTARRCAISRFRADRLLFLLIPAPGSRILDVCAGTGALALGASQVAGNAGRVTAN
jgi:ubiquinone/menaquinone biosynthesis C-methylase UbiE